jgi:L-amino acid N-acyltransferase YncA
MSTILIRELSENDFEAVTAVFNYFIVNSLAAYSEQEVGREYMKHFFKSSLVSCVLDVDGKTIGFGCVKPYKDLANFSHTGVLTYFILPQYTRMGLGTRMLDHLFKESLVLGITNMLANISSGNDQSLQFHKKHGFVECGRFKRMGKKFGDFYDIVWVQKDLSHKSFNADKK